MRRVLTATTHQSREMMSVNDITEPIRPHNGMALTVQTKIHAALFDNVCHLLLDALTETLSLRVALLNVVDYLQQYEQVTTTRTHVTTT